jgi:predicted house-cleaning noncanonical NTP pyrophosphatase (MazG superfamily)
MTIKLIRDRVPVDDGGQVVGHVHGCERVVYLFSKLEEEILEAWHAWRDGDKGLVTELADCLKVLLALAEGTGIGWAAVDSARQRKALERGGFTLGRLYERSDRPGIVRVMQPHREEP